MKKFSKILVILTFVLSISVSMAAYAMDQTGPGYEKREGTIIETVATTNELDNIVCMFGKQYTPFDNINGITLYCREDDMPEQHVIDALIECNLSNEVSDYIKILNISAYISEKLSYDTAAAQMTNTNQNYWKENPNPFTSKCIIEGQAVCAGYAELFQDMCKAIGLECYYITGYTTQGGKEPVYHAWNGVTIDGLTYYVDTCWYDGGTNFRWCDTEQLVGHDITAWHEQYRINSRTAVTEEKN